MGSEKSGEWRKGKSLINRVTVYKMFRNSWMLDEDSQDQCLVVVSGSSSLVGPRNVISGKLCTKLKCVDATSYFCRT